MWEYRSANAAAIFSSVNQLSTNVNELYLFILNPNGPIPPMCLTISGTLPVHIPLTSVCAYLSKLLIDLKTLI